MKRGDQDFILLDTKDKYKKTPTMCLHRVFVSNFSEYNGTTCFKNTLINTIDYHNKRCSFFMKLGNILKHYTVNLQPLPLLAVCSIL
jgi:hypothetical protein